MQLPVKAHYAVLAMLAMARRYDSGELAPSKAIAETHQIPCQFLGQILQQLRAAKLIVSTRGANGGFRLSTPPNEISVADVVDAVCPGATDELPRLDAEPLAVAVHSIWSELAMQQRDLLQRISLAQLLERAEDHAEMPMFYI